MQGSIPRWRRSTAPSQRRASISAGAAQKEEHDAPFEYTAGERGSSLAIEGVTTARVFETYLEKAVVRSLHVGQIVVMDNLSAYKTRRIRELIEQQGYELLYLPAYSPDYVRKEEVFRKIKNLRRKAAARNKEALVEAIGQALSVVTAEDALSYFEHAEYGPMGLLL